LRAGTVVGSIFLGILGFLMLTIVLAPFGVLIMFVAFIMFIYGLVASPREPFQYVAATPCPTCGQPLTFVQKYNRWYCYNCGKYTGPPAPYSPSGVTLCPQCKSSVAADANYCPKCGADTKVRAKEIIKEKEIIVKIKCSYCGTLFDETLDTCPHCGAKH